MTRPQAPDAPQYRAARLRQALAEDPRTAELGVRVTVRGDHVLLSGQVVSEQRRDELQQVLADVAPDLAVYNDVRVTCADEPSGREELR
ncbi:BON domain-containing protein [Actinophytocola sp.]|uniref:BON domain-containing protein n=1 Tax=Actinophytocola sp. TaxID=1872138 RepID=UPI002D8038F3|nr:BON domain-containing protein [Actinophytocola sp.]HET9138649.1 BON domain-containing protein [Actinophytocola sp.]